MMTEINLMKTAMLKKLTITFCIGLVLNLFFSPTTFAKDDNEGKISEIKTKIQSLGTGTDAKIKLTLNDKTKLKGYISESNDQSFTVTNAGTNQITKINYSQVKKASGRNGLTGRTIAIGFVILVIVGAVIFATLSSDH